MIDRPKGSKTNPIPIQDISEARANQTYVIQPSARKPKKEASDGEAVSHPRSTDRL